MKAAMLNHMSGRASGLGAPIFVSMVAVLGLVLAACSGAAPTPTSAPVPTSAPTAIPTVTTAAPTATSVPPTATTAPPAATTAASPTAAPLGKATVRVGSNPKLGSMLIDQTGRSLYLYTRDERNKSNCSGACAQNWPPLLTAGDPAAGDGVTQATLGTIQRADGGTQVTYDGWPLYYYTPDAAPGDVKGQNVGTVWFALTADGAPIQDGALIKSVQNDKLGPVLADRSGRILYIYTRDELDKSNCSGGCARNWPPVLTVGDPTSGDGIAKDLLSTIKRADGAAQVTYKGQPLYYYFQDARPGDATGQNVGTVWFVLSPAGQVIKPAAPSPTATPAPSASVAATSAKQSAIKGFKLETITVPVGASVTWTNQDSAPHTVTSGAPAKADGAWTSAALNAGQSYSQAFPKAGE